MESAGDTEARAVSGYAMVQERFTSQPSMVILGASFNEVWNQYRLQLTRGAGGNADVQGESADAIVVRGELYTKADFPTEGMIWFVVRSADYPNGVYFRVSQDNPVIALSQPGHQLEVTAFDLRVSEVNDVVSIMNASLPPVTVTP